MQYSFISFSILLSLTTFIVYNKFGAILANGQVDRRLLVEFRPVDMNDGQENRRKIYKDACRRIMKKTHRIENIPHKMNVTFLEHKTLDMLRPVGINNKSNIDIIMCAPPKTGTTHWQMMMIALQSGKSIEEVAENIKPSRIYSSLKRFSKFNENDLLKYGRLLFEAKPLKIINTRQPLARLYSCWHDKFTLWENAGFVCIYFLSIHTHTSTHAKNLVYTQENTQKN